jgi:putative transcriptional regulator
MIRHHPDEMLLLEHGAGRLDPAMRLIVETHLFYCAQCRAPARLAARTGGALLEKLAPVALAEDALARTLVRLGAQDAPVPQVSNDNTPSPLRAFMGMDLSAVRWRGMGPSLSYVNLYRQGPVAVRLLRGAPGADTGQHGHHGQEYTLVLRGGFRDETGAYGPGDFQSASPEVTHNPVADADGACINLAVTNAPLRFQALVPRIVGRLFGF